MRACEQARVRVYSRARVEKGFHISSWTNSQRFQQTTDWTHAKTYTTVDSGTGKKTYGNTPIDQSEQDWAS